jgi:small neutral amino acid transporter SnatA (MarC family)
LRFTGTRTWFAFLKLFEYILRAASLLFVVMDPLAVVPVFPAMTPNDTAEQRIRRARLACDVTTGVRWLVSVTVQFMLNAIKVFRLDLFVLPPA